MSEKELELQAEVDRLRKMVKLIDAKYEKRTAILEWTDTGFICTCPSTMDEMDFGRFVASSVALMVNTVAKVGAVQAIGHEISSPAATVTNPTTELDAARKE